MSTATKADSPTAAQRMPGHRILTYSFGDVANNLSFMMTSMFLMVYMTEIAGLAAGVAGAIYGITKIWAGIADLIAGQTVDRFDTRWGRLRPWILFGSTPLIVSMVLLFSTPAGLSPILTIAWIFLFDAAFQLAYSFVNIPYGSLSAAMTQDPVDRSKLSGARSIGSAITSVGLSAVIAPQFQDTTGDDVRLKFTLTCIALGAVALILYWICFANAREVVPRSPGKVSVKRTVQTIKSNKPLLTLCLGSLFLLASIFTMNAVAMYYAVYVLGNASWFVWLTAAQTVGTILVASFVPSITVQLGKRGGFVSACLVIMFGFATIYFLPTGVLWTAVVAWFILGVGVGGTNTLIFSMQADTVDYGEWKTGVRSEGGSYSVLSFVRKVGQGIGGWAGGAVMGAFGYIGGIDSQSAEALEGIRIATGVIPASLALIAAIIMWRYPMGMHEHEKIVDELNERRTRTAIASGKGVDEERVLIEDDLGDGRTTLLRQMDGEHPPIVTIFGQRGSGATEVAPLVAQGLGVDYIGQRFSSSELSQVDKKDLISDSGFDRWLRSVALSGSGNTESSVGSNLSLNSRVARDNTAAVIEAVEDGGVIMGRNGALVLGPAYGAIHVRLVAPLNKRVERVVNQMGLSTEEAQEQCLSEDRLRAEMSRALYQWNPNDDEDYDLVINTGSMTYQQAAEIIVDFYRSKYRELAEKHDLRKSTGTQ